MLRKQITKTDFWSFLFVCLLIGTSGMFLIFTALVLWLAWPADMLPVTLRLYFKIGLIAVLGLFVALAAIYGAFNFIERTTVV